jgi:hypothetical protein
MNRCTSFSPVADLMPKRRFFSVLALGLLTASLAAAQQNPMQNIRPFPPAAQRGVMVIAQPPELLLNEKVDRLSPGARIRGTNNMLVMSGSLIGQKLLVNYVREPGGAIHEVWILTEAEAALKLPTQK